MVLQACETVRHQRRQLLTRAQAKVEELMWAKVLATLDIADENGKLTRGFKILLNFPEILTARCRMRSGNSRNCTIVPLH